MSRLLAVDLSGSWALDRKAGEDMDTLLVETQDLSWLERQLAGSVDVWWEGEVLVVESKGALADGTSALYRTERWIEGDDMFFVLSIDAEDGRSWKVKRVLRRS